MGDIAGIIFDNQPIKANELAIINKVGVTDGVLTGCGLTYSADDLTIAAGTIIVQGRMMKLASPVTKELSGLANGYARVKVVLDMTGAATLSEFGQAYFAIDYSATAGGFAALTQEDINGAGSMYEFALAIITLASGAISGVLVQPLAASNALQSAVDALSANVTYYVNYSTGSQYNNGLSSGAALDTVQRALDKLPKNLKGYYVTINVASNTTAASNTVIRGFSNGRITISGASAAYVGQVNIVGCSASILLSNITPKQASGATFISCVDCASLSLSTVAAGAAVIGITNCAFAFLTSITLSGSPTITIDNSFAMINGVSGTCGSTNLFTATNSWVNIKNNTTGNTTYGNTLSAITTT